MIFSLLLALASCKNTTTYDRVVVAENGTTYIPLNVTVNSENNVVAIKEARRLLIMYGYHKDSINKLKFNIKSN